MLFYFFFDFLCKEAILVSSIGCYLYFLVFSPS